MRSLLFFWVIVSLGTVLPVRSQPVRSDSSLIPVFDPDINAIIPYDQPDLNAPGRGVEQWHDRNLINVPLKNVSSQRLDVYYRFTWNKLENAQGNYTWTYFDSLVNEAIRKRQKLSFGIMTCYSDGRGDGIVEYDKGTSAYPAYLHQLMQSETVKDWKGDGSKATTGFGSWVPNYNSEYYLQRLLALYEALNAHIESSSAYGVKYKDVIGYVDIRGYGNWGEWHHGTIIDDMSRVPPGARATVATLKRIIDAHIVGFPNFPLVAMIAAFDANRLPIIMNPPEIGYYALTAKNSWGMIGWRRDQWGVTDAYLSDYLENNNASFNGVVLKDLIMDKWKCAPIVGEPPAWGDVVNGCLFGDLERQIRLYHASSFGNGNYGVVITDCMKDQIRAASKAAGYRIIFYRSNIVTKDRSLSVSLNWKNTGIAPAYESWLVIFELMNSSGKSVWSDTSSFKLKLFLPREDGTVVVDHFYLPENIPSGNYELNVIIRDPNGYRAALPLAIKGRSPDGSYTLKRNLSIK